MHLEVTCSESGKPIRLDFVAMTRASIPEYFSVVCPHDGIVHGFNPADVRAVADSKAPAGMTAIGATVGLIGGEVGLLLGGVIGALLGWTVLQRDQASADAFNKS